MQTPSSSSSAVNTPTEKKEETPTPVNLDRKTKTSGLSLKSIQQKKEWLNQQNEQRKPSEVKQNEPFSINQLHAAWNEYIKHLQKHGNHNLASIIGADLPTIKEETKIQVELPTQTMKLELERAQHQLMGYLRKKMSNDYIQLEIEVNEAVEKKYIFTARDKYNKLKEKNPHIDLLRKTFDLDI